MRLEGLDSPTTAAGSEDVADWALLRAAHEAALERIFGRHATSVHTYAFRRVASWQVAEDVVQATFTTVWRRARDGRLDALTLASARPYLLVVARNECGNVRRGERRRLALVRRVPPESVSGDHADDTAARVDDEQAMSEIRRALTRIPESQREAVELVAWSHCSLAEAAAVLGVPVSTVKSRLFRARRTLAGLLDLHDVDAGGS